MDVFDLEACGTVVVIGFKGTVDKEAAVRLVSEQKARRAAGQGGTAAFLERHPEVRSNRAHGQQIKTWPSRGSR